MQDLFPAAESPDLLVGLGTPDDAAVYRLDDARALIVTTDFFTPIVDDAHAYGAIAAANALSDVYAMGGSPLLALTIAALPPDLPLDVTSGIMRGLAETVRDARAVIAGGHTIQDKEPKVGLAVVGLGHPDRLLTKGGARPGDALVLTKPLGTGCITTAAKNDKADPAALQEAVGWMTRLNRDAAEVAVDLGLRAATDITGFGLLGHGTEVAAASDVTLRIAFGQIPFMAGAWACAEQWTFPGGASANRVAYEAGVAFDPALDEMRQMMLFDPQTSGGLLIGVPQDRLDAFGAAMAARGAAWWQIGTTEPRGAAGIIVTA